MKRRRKGRVSLKEDIRVGRMVGGREDRVSEEPGEVIS